nr:unnamed protein product [Digitaria exilis]
MEHDSDGSSGAAEPIPYDTPTPHPSITSDLFVLGDSARPKIWATCSSAPSSRDLAPNGDRSTPKQSDPLARTHAPRGKGVRPPGAWAVPTALELCKACPVQAVLYSQPGVQCRDGS